MTAPVAVHPPPLRAARFDMIEWAICCGLAERDPQLAARRFLIVATEEAARRLMEAALWREEDVGDFEARGRPVCIEGRFGVFWLAPSRCWELPLLPNAPRISPAALVVLAKAVVVELCTRGEGGRT